MDALPAYNISYNVCALFVLGYCLASFLYRKSLRQHESKRFACLILIQVAACIFNILSVSIGNSPDLRHTALRTLFEALYLWLHAFTVCYGCWYVVRFIGFAWNRGREMLLFLPEILLVAVPLCVPYLRDQIFYFDAAGIYRHGPLMLPCIYGFSFFYAGLLVFLWFSSRRQAGVKYAKLSIGMLLLAAASVIAQGLFFPTQLVNEFFIAMATYSLLAVLEELGHNYNYKTCTYNRQAFHRVMEERLQSGEPFSAIVVTLKNRNYVKSLMRGRAVFDGLMEQIGIYLNSLHPNIDVYSCDQGTFFLTTYSKRSRLDLERVAKRIAERFEKPFRAGGEEWTYPVRITVLNLPEDAGTIEELIKIVGIPFLADSERAPMITDAKTLLARLQEEEQWREKAEESGKKGTNLQVISGVIPEALRIMLDDFTSRIGSLTQAESQILLYYMDGYDVADIPDLASVTINTVRKHNRNIYSKLAIKSKEELMLYLDILQRCDMFDPIEEQLKIQANQRLEAGA